MGVVSGLFLWELSCQDCFYGSCRVRIVSMGVVLSVRIVSIGIVLSVRIVSMGVVLSVRIVSIGIVLSVRIVSMGVVLSVRIVSMGVVLSVRIVSMGVVLSEECFYGSCPVRGLSLWELSIGVVLSVRIVSMGVVLPGFLLLLFHPLHVGNWWLCMSKFCKRKKECRSCNRLSSKVPLPNKDGLSDVVLSG